jgi:phosphatidate cytidylyltransferase
MLKRTVTSLVLIPVAFLLILYPGGLPFAVAMCLITAFGSLEFYGGVRKIGARPIEWAGVIASVLFVASMRTYHDGKIGAVLPAMLSGLIVISLVVEILRKKRAPIVNVGATVFGAVYVGYLLSHVVVLRSLPGTLQIWGQEVESGAAFVLYIFLCTWASDTGAYFIGRSYGRTKIAPKLSPNKTFEGSVAAFVSTVLAAVFFGWVIHLPYGHALALGAIFGVVAQLGDLSESAIKREIGIKDFGAIFPGHGGILDRFDSMLFTGPAAYYYVTLFLHNWPSR